MASAMYNSPDSHRPAPPAPSNSGRAGHPLAAPPFYPNPRPSYPPAAAVAPPTRAQPDRARIAGIALLAAAGVVLLAALTKSWFTAGHGDGGVGLLGLESCRHGMCRTATWFDINRIPAQIPIFATSALIACLVTVGFLIHGGVMLVQGRPEAVKMKWIAQLLGLSAFGVTAFIFSLSIGEWSRGLSIGWSAFVGIAGVAGTGAVTAFLVRPLTQGAR